MRNLFRTIRNVVLNQLIYVTTIVSKIWLYINGCKIGKDFRCYGIPFIKNNRGMIIIGDGVRVNSAQWPNPIGYYPKTCIQMQPNSVLRIGNNTGISNAAITCFQNISIGNYVMIGAGVKIYDSDFHPLSSEMRRIDSNNNVMSKKIEIQDDVFIGSGSIILKGSIIEKGSVIGAGSVVCGHIPSYEIWAGNPAKFIKKVKID